MISNEAVSAAGQNEILYRKPPTLCQRFAEIKPFRYNVEIHSYYIVRSYKLKPIFAANLKLSTSFSRKIHSCAQVSDCLKTKYPNSRGFPERTVRRYCKENEISSRTDTNEVNRMVADAVGQVKLRLSVINFLCLSAFV